MRCCQLPQLGVVLRHFILLGGGNAGIWLSPVIFQMNMARNPLQWTVLHPECHHYLPWPFVAPNDVNITECSDRCAADTTTPWATKCKKMKKLCQGCIECSLTGPHPYLVAPFCSHYPLDGQCNADSDCGSRSYLKLRVKCCAATDALNSRIWLIV